MFSVPWRWNTWQRQTTAPIAHGKEMLATTQSALTVCFMFEMGCRGLMLMLIETEMKNSAWYYPAPKEKATNIKDYVAFCEYFDWLDCVSFSTWLGWSSSRRETQRSFNTTPCASTSRLIWLQTRTSSRWPLSRVKGKEDWETAYSLREWIVASEMPVLYICWYRVFWLVANPRLMCFHECQRIIS